MKRQNRLLYYNLRHIPHSFRVQSDAACRSTICQRVSIDRINKFDEIVISHCAYLFTKLITGRAVDSIIKHPVILFCADTASNPANDQVP